MAGIVSHKKRILTLTSPARAAIQIAAGDFCPSHEPSATGDVRATATTAIISDIDYN